MDESARQTVFPFVSAKPWSFVLVCLILGAIILGFTFYQQILRLSSLWEWAHVEASAEKIRDGKKNGWRLQMTWVPSMPSLQGWRRNKPEDIESTAVRDPTEAGYGIG
jgi:hypothetical protein